MVFELVWSRNGTPTTLGSELDDMDITDLTAYKFNQFMVHLISGASSTFTPDMTFDNTGGNDYARRNSTNGGADSTVTSAAFVENGLGGIPTGTDSFTIDYVCNIASEEKLGIYFNIAAPAGAATAPSRAEGVFKKDTTTDTVQFTRVDINNTDAGGFATNSNISAIGTD